MKIRLRSLVEWIIAAVFAFIIVQLLHLFVFIPTQVNGQSMEPTFSDGQYVIVDRWPYWFNEPQRGDVIVFRAPTGENYIKRVIGLPGEMIQVEDDYVYINGYMLREYYIEEEIERLSFAGGYNGRNFAGAIVPEGHVFVMGDNRSHSLDSRSPRVGTVPFEKIIGRADVTIWPLSDIHIVRHGEVEVLP